MFNLLSRRVVMNNLSILLSDVSVRSNVKISNKCYA